MEWTDRLNSAIAYIEEHLTEEIDYAELGRIACCSAYHFQRMFGYMADVPLSEYIRRRRMSRALTELQSGQSKIIDIALKYGYDSPTAFNRAFQSVHGMPPSRAGEPGVTLTTYPPISFCITIKGAVQMEYRIEKKDAFSIVGVSTPLEKEIEKNFQTVPKLWEKASMDGTLPRLCEMMNAEPKAVLGVSACNEDAEAWRYYIAVATTLQADGLEQYTVPAATWAVFPGHGKGSSIQQLEERIVDWLPTSGYEYGNGPDVEVYLNADPENAQYEVWIPVVKKA